MNSYTDFRKQLTELINRYSMENGSHTPDYILADYLVECLDAYDKATQRKQEHINK